MDFKSKYWVAIFPYLKTSDDLRYKNIVIKNSGDKSGLPNEISDFVDELCKMFYLRSDVQIDNLSFAFNISENEVQSPIEFVSELNEFQTLLCYLYSSPHPTLGDPFLSREHSSYYLFRPTKVSEDFIFANHNVNILADIDQFEVDEIGDISGYEGRLNNKTYFWVTHKDKIFPPAAHMWLNISQDISSDFFNNSSRYNSVISYFTRRKENNQLGQRVLTAINWYNRSLSMDLEEEVALVNLSIAFESLLGLDQGNNITNRFKESVNVILGGFPRLESWAIQFYNARSDIVHEGKSHRLSFIATDKPKNNNTNELIYRPLVSYGRQIFQACVATILTGARLSEEMRLSSQLVTNKQRLESICQKLSKRKGTPKERISAVSKEVYEIEAYRFIPEHGLEIDNLIGAAKLLAQQYLKTISEDKSELNVNMQKLSETDSKDHYELLSTFNEVFQILKELPISISDTSNNELHIVKSLFQSIWRYVYMYYYQLKIKRKK